MNAQEKILCPVCQVNFILKETKEAGKRIICPVCGAVLVMVLKQDQIVLERPKDISLEDEIRHRMDNFARFRGYHFNEMKEALVEVCLKAATI